MGRTAKPWYRTTDQWWYATITPGTPRRKLLKGKPTQADERRAWEVFNRLRASTNPNASLDGSQCAHVVELFLDHLFAQGNPGDQSADPEDSPSLENYRNHRKLLNYFTADCGKVLVRDLTLQHAERFLQKHATKTPRKVEKIIVVNGKERRQVNVTKPWGENYQATFTKSLKACFNWAVDSEIISRHPFNKLKRSFQYTERDIVDQDTWQRMINDTKDEPFRNFLTAIRNTGCRPSEVARVTASHVKGATWNFVKHKANRGKKASKKTRVVYLNPAMQELSAKLVAQNPEGPLFLNSRGRRWTKDSVGQRFESLRTRLGLPEHVIAYATGRHSWINNAMINGVPKAVVAHMAGTSENVIDRYYAHLDSEAQYLLNAAELATRRLPAK